MPITGRYLPSVDRMGHGRQKPRYLYNEARNGKPPHSSDYSAENLDFALSLAPIL